MIGEVKSALGESLDQFDNASPAFKQARALHRQWAEQYSDPEGVSRLINRDAKGNFLNEDNWRRADNGLIGLGVIPILLLTLILFWGLGGIARLSERKSSLGMSLGGGLIVVLSAYAAYGLVERALQQDRLAQAQGDILERRDCSPRYGRARGKGFA